MKISASLVALMSVFSFAVGACGGKQEPAASPGPAPVAGPTRTPSTPKPMPADERQPRREIEPRAPMDTPPGIERIEKTEPTEKVEEAKEAKPTAPDGPSGDGDAAKGEAKYEITITDAAVTPEIADRIPTERRTTWTIGVDTKVIAWFEVKNSGDEVPLTLVWKKNGKEAWRFDTEVGKGKNWRTWAEKKIGKKDAGKWTVELVDDGGFAYETLAYDIVAGASATAP